MSELDPVTPPPAEPVAPADPPAPPPDPDEAQAIEVQGGKMVPLAALKAAREEAKQAKEASARVQQLEAELAATRPYAEFVKANPGLLQPQQPQPAPAKPTDDPELVELARSLDYYNADGSPNVDRAAKHQAIIDKRAAKLAQEMVGPVATATATQMSNANWSQVMTSKLPNGQAIDPTIVAEFWKHLPVGETAKPQVAAMVRDLAMMEQLKRSPLPNTPPPPVAPPVHTDNVGRLPAPASRMTTTERNVAASRGLSEEKYQKLTADFQPGRMNALED